jgi:hypothetical protein
LTITDPAGTRPKERQNEHRTQGTERSRLQGHCQRLQNQFDIEVLQRERGVDIAKIIDASGYALAA